MTPPPDEHVLAHKTEIALFVALTFSGKKRRPSWEWTDKLDSATRFASPHEAEEKSREHRVPPCVAKPVSYITAHTAWVRHGVIEPYRAKQMRFEL